VVAVAIQQVVQRDAELAGERTGACVAGVSEIRPDEPRPKTKPKRRPPQRDPKSGGDLGSIFAPFGRLGQPGDPSYISGSGGDGQVSQGNQQGAGVDPGSYVNYQQVYSQFLNFAMTTLDRGYLPLSARDFVRDYFSSLDPSN